MKKNLIIGGLVLIILLLMYKSCHVSKELREYKTVTEALNDTLVSYRDKDDKHRAKIQTLETENVNKFLRIQTRDSIILKLQNKVRKYRKKLREEGSSITTVEIITILDTVPLKEIVYIEVIKGDTVYLDSLTVYIYKDKWIDLALSDDNLDLSIKNEFDIILGEEGFFRKKSFAEIISHNPYTETKTLRTYRVSMKKKRFGVGLQIGYGISSDLTPTPYLGLGINYNILNF